jgi:hypothetical protein
MTTPAKMTRVYPGALGNIDTIACESNLENHKENDQKFHGGNANSNLTEIIGAGLIALPVFLSSLKTLQETNCSQKLPRSVSQPSELIQRSMVCCPISIGVCQTPLKAAVILDCGHIVGYASVTNMMEVEIQKGKHTFKCLTCPNEQAVGTLRIISY